MTQVRRLPEQARTLNDRGRSFARLQRSARAVGGRGLAIADAACPAGYPARPTQTRLPGPLRRYLGKIGFYAQVAVLAVGGIAFAQPAAVAAGLTSVPLAPPGTHIGYTVYAIGLVPIDASFGAFSGTLSVDAAHPALCKVQVTVRIASLHMDDASRQQVALGPTMLDAARFPTMHFAGHCATAGLTGQLTLHGVTRPLTLTLKRKGAHVTATGSVKRADFGIAGLPGLVGGRIRIHLDAVLPPGLATAALHREHG